MRVWKFLTFVSRSHGKHKYALAGLRLMASRLALLTPRQAHRLTWNRIANKQGGVGKCISRDLRVEQMNHVSKQAIRGIGAPNVTPAIIQSTTQSTGSLEKLLGTSSKYLGRNDDAVNTPYQQDQASSFYINIKPVKHKS